MTAIISSLPYIQIALAIVIIVLVLLQKSEASSGGTFGGNDNWNSAYHTRRGFEKIMFNTTVILGILFAISSLAALFLK
ncbi:MAG: preprotein translocase subunit SecG [Candidatus Paceibacterota bacterium]|jgi:protein translocase SecG subunit